MAEFVRAVIGRLRGALADRRRSPRKHLRLPCAVTLHEPHATGALRPSRAYTLEGTTRDLSASGVALILPAVRAGERYLTDAELRLVLEHPTGPLTMIVRPVRYEQLPPEGAERGYLVGARIIRMDEEARARYEAHLRQLH